MKKKKLFKVNDDVKYGYIWENELIPRVKYCKECKLKEELTPTSEVINLDDNIFDIKSRPTIEVKRFSNLVERV